MILHPTHDLLIGHGSAYSREAQEVGEPARPFDLTTVIVYLSLSCWIAHKRNFQSVSGDPHLRESSSSTTHCSVRSSATRHAMRM